MELFQHQKDIINEDMKSVGIFLGVGGAKTRIALLLATGKTLVVAPKMQVEDLNWEREVKKIKLNIDLTVISKEKFRKIWNGLPFYNTFILDEAHNFCGANPQIVWKNKIPLPKTSQLFDATHNYLLKHRPERFYPVTATPTRSPMAVWAMGKLLGRQWNFYDFRSTYYYMHPMTGREIWMPKRDEKTKLRLAKTVQSLGYVGRLEDWFDVPEQTFVTKYFEPTASQKQWIKKIEELYPDPLVRFGKTDQIENGIVSGDEYVPDEVLEIGKHEYISELAAEYPKMLIFAKYTKQIEALRDMLEDEGYTVLTLTGATKDRGEFMKQANILERCIVIAQSQISAGYELPEYPITVFASLSGSLVDLIQSQGRTQRANNIKKNLYVYLVTKGDADEARYKTNMAKEDFHEAIYLKQKK